MLDEFKKYGVVNVECSILAYYNVKLICKIFHYLAIILLRLRCRFSLGVFRLLMKEQKEVERGKEKS